MSRNCCVMALELYKTGLFSCFCSFGPCHAIFTQLHRDIWAKVKTSQMTWGFVELLPLIYLTLPLIYLTLLLNDLILPLIYLTSPLIYLTLLLMYLILPLIYLALLLIYLILPLIYLIFPMISLLVSLAIFTLSFTKLSENVFGDNIYLNFENQPNCRKIVDLSNSIIYNYTFSGFHFLMISGPRSNTVPVHRKTWWLRDRAVFLIWRW